jgi:hypothetical protein
LSFEAIYKDFGEFATIDQILKIVLFGPKETRPENNAEIVSIHFIMFFLADDEISKKDHQQYENLLVNVFHLF